MPSLYFYAVEDDHPLLVDCLFEPDLDLRAFETQSRPNEGIREFHSADEVLGAWRGSSPGSLTLALLAPDSGVAPTFRKVSLRGPSYRQGDYDFRCEGWGLIHLHVGQVMHDQLSRSTLGHNSERRAAGRAQTYDWLGAPDAWNWEAVTATSRALNRGIRKAASGFVGSRPVLPAAYQASQSGLLLDPA